MLCYCGCEYIERVRVYVYIAFNHLLSLHVIRARRIRAYYSNTTAANDVTACLVQYWILRDFIWVR